MIGGRQAVSHTPTGQECGRFRRAELRATVCADFVRYAERGEVGDQGPCEALCAGQGGDDVGSPAETVNDDQVSHTAYHAEVGRDGLEGARGN